MIQTNPDNMPSVPHCPVIDPGRVALKASLSLVRALRHLHTAMVYCTACPVQEECTVQEDLNAQIDAGIMDVNQEWGLL
jgi:metal-sulfur cluster biosynthetic enzyme